MSAFAVFVATFVVSVVVLGWLVFRAVRANPKRGGGGGDRG